MCKQLASVLNLLWETLFVLRKQIDRIASSDEPYIKILQVQDDGSQELMYIDTWKQELLFDPETYNGNASSNSSGIHSIQYSEKFLCFSRVELLL